MAAEDIAVARQVPPPQRRGEMEVEDIAQNLDPALDVIPDPAEPAAEHIQRRFPIQNVDENQPWYRRRKRRIVIFCGILLLDVVWCYLAYVFKDNHQWLNIFVTLAITSTSCSFVTVISDRKKGSNDNDPNAQFIDTLFGDQERAPRRPRQADREDLQDVIEEPQPQIEDLQHRDDPQPQIEDPREDPHPQLKVVPEARAEQSGSSSGASLSSRRAPFQAVADFHHGASSSSSSPPYETGATGTTSEEGETADEPELDSSERTAVAAERAAAEQGQVDPEREAAAAGSEQGQAGRAEAAAATEPGQAAAEADSEVAVKDADVTSMSLDLGQI